MIHFPPYVEETLKKTLKEVFYRGTKREVFIGREFTIQDLRFFADGAVQLSNYFTSERSQLPKNYLNDPKIRAGYLFYFFPINFCKSQSVFSKLPPSFFEKKSLSILDLGAGPMTATLGLVDLFFQKRSEKQDKPIVFSSLAIDQNRGSLEDGREMQKKLESHWKENGFSYEWKSQTESFDFYHPQRIGALFKNKKFDLIILSNLLNELQISRSEKVEFVQFLSQFLSKEGWIVLIDPALQRTSRELMEIRDQIMAENDSGLDLVSPCLHSEFCPMLAVTRRDWCHFYVKWEEPEFMKQLDIVLENKNEYLKCSYFIFSNFDSKNRNVSPKSQSTYRLISNLMGSKGKSEAIVCGPSGRWHLTRLDNQAGQNNNPFVQAHRGDLIYVPKIPPSLFEIDGNLSIRREDMVEAIETF